MFSTCYFSYFSIFLFFFLFFIFFLFFMSYESFLGEDPEVSGDFILYAIYYNMS